MPAAYDEGALAERRRTSLIVLRDRYGGNLTAIVGEDDRGRVENIRSHLSQLVNRHWPKTHQRPVRIGQGLASLIEDRLGLERGWLARDHNRRVSQCPYCGAERRGLDNTGGCEA